MNIENRLKLIQEVGEEILTPKDLRDLLEKKKRPTAYDGFEPSGVLHISQGLMRAINVNKMIKAGCKFKMWVADWFAWMNNKLGGDLDKIRTVGKYQIEVWKSCGMATDKIDFLWAKDVMSDDEYWKKVVLIAKNNTISRIMRCAEIMGRQESVNMPAAGIFYPCMQCADIFHLKADIAQLGMDQRKVNVLARETGPKIGFWKPVVVSHHMLRGLLAPPKDLGKLSTVERGLALKMSKSIPASAIFMTDTEETVNKKIKDAYCPAKQIQDNPLLEMSKYILFEKYPEIKIERSKKFGGDILYKSYRELEKDFSKGELHPLDLKAAAARYINDLLTPTRKHFKKKGPADLLKQVEKFRVTR